MNRTILSTVGALFFLCAVCAASDAQAASAKVTSGVVNVNTASAEQLCLLPGIGPNKARAILEHRTKQPFTRIEDLQKVKGIGGKLVEKLRPMAVTEGETTARAAAKRSRRK